MSAHRSLRSHVWIYSTGMSSPQQEAYLTHLSYGWIEAQCMVKVAVRSVYSIMNPCPCGYYGDPVKQCTCSSMTVSRYQKRISGPLLDRIDTVPGLRCRAKYFTASLWMMTFTASSRKANQRGLLGTYLNPKRLALSLNSSSVSSSQGRY